MKKEHLSLVSFHIEQIQSHIPKNPCSHFSWARRHKYVNWVKTKLQWPRNVTCYNGVHPHWKISNKTKPIILPTLTRNYPTFLVFSPACFVCKWQHLFGFDTKAGYLVNQKTPPLRPNPTFAPQLCLLCPRPHRMYHKPMVIDSPPI